MDQRLGNQVFVPYKAIGQVCGHVPLAYRSKGGGNLRHPVVLAAVGNVVQQVEKLNKLNQNINSSTPEI